jgi:hypothetical protein
MSEYTRPHAVPQDPGGRQPQGRQQDPPDFLMLAHGQLVRAHLLTEKAERNVTEAPEGADMSAMAAQVIEWRLKIAAGYTTLADIQYSIPDEGDGDEGDGEEDDGGYDPRRRR